MLKIKRSQRLKVCSGNLDAQSPCLRDSDPAEAACAFACSAPINIKRGQTQSILFVLPLEIRSMVYRHSIANEIVKVMDLPFHGLMTYQCNVFDYDGIWPLELRGLRRPWLGLPLESSGDLNKKGRLPLLLSCSRM